MAEYLDLWASYTTSEVWNKLKDLGFTEENIKEWKATRLDRDEYAKSEQELQLKETALIIKMQGFFLCKLQKELEDYGMDCSPKVDENNTFLSYMLIEHLQKEEESKDVSEETSGDES